MADFWYEIHLDMSILFAADGQLFAGDMYG